MYVDKANKVLWLSVCDIGRTTPCVICDKLYKSNSTGPSKYPRVTKILHALPSEDIIGGLPAMVHDFAYLLCPEGWTVCTKYDGIDYKATSKTTADKIYLQLMLAQIEVRCHYKVVKNWYRGMAYRNYKFVKEFGHDSYRHIH